MKLWKAVIVALALIIGWTLVGWIVLSVFSAGGKLGILVGILVLSFMMLKVG